MLQHWILQKYPQINNVFGIEDKSMNSALYIVRIVHLLNSEEQSLNLSDTVFCLWKITVRAFVPTKIKWKRASLKLSIF